MGRGNTEETANVPRRGVLMPRLEPEASDFRPGFDRQRHYPPRVPSGRNINILPLISETIVEAREEPLPETMRRVIKKDLEEMSGTDEIYYYFQSNHEGLVINYPDGEKEEFQIDEKGLHSILKNAGNEESHTYLLFAKDFYFDPYKGKDPVYTERKRLEKAAQEHLQEIMNNPEYQEELESIFDFVESDEEWQEKEKLGELNPDGRITIIKEKADEKAGGNS